MYGHLNVTGNPVLAVIDRFKLTTDPKKGAIVFNFTMVINGFRWENKKVIVPKILHEKFGEVNAIKNF